MLIYASQIAIAFFALLLSAGTAQAELRGKVVSVLDGDTIDLLVNRQPVRVRLVQIDAPEKRQPYGNRAKQALAALSFGKTATVIESDQDRYGRALGTLYVAGLNINIEMVKQGMAWVYRRYATDPRLFVTEASARAEHRGLWADPAPIPPWEYRRETTP